MQRNNVIGAANGNKGIFQPGYASYNGVFINSSASVTPFSAVSPVHKLPDA